MYHELGSDLEEPKKVTLVCSLRNYYPEKATVEWLEDGISLKSQQTVKKFSDENGDDNSKTFSQVSQVEVAIEKWRSGSEYTCKVSHNSHSTALNTSICRDLHGITSPSILLKKPNLDGAARDEDVTASCVVYTPYECTVSWIENDDPAKTTEATVKNHIEDSNKRIQNYVYNLTRPKHEWISMKSMSCEATHKCFPPVKKTINLTDERIAPPTITLYHQLMSSSSPAGANGVTLVCSLMGFYPKNIAVHWEEDNRQLTSSIVTNTFQNVGEKHTTFSSVSQVNVDISKWLTGSVYTCRAKHYSTELSNSTSICSAYPISSPSITLETFASNEVITATCKVSSPYKTTVTWIVDDNPNNKKESTNYFFDAPNSKYVYNLTVNRNEWKSMRSISCEAKHKCFPSVKKTFNLTGEPSVELYLLPGDKNSEEKVQKVLCLASGFNPQVTWHIEHHQRPATANRMVTENDGHITVASEIEVPYQDWTSDKTVSCKVDDQSPLAPIHKNISMCSMTPPSSQTAQLFLIGPSFEKKEEQGDIPVVCQLVGFNTKDFTFTWKVNGNTRQQGAVTTPPSKNDNGTETMSSTFNVRRSDWLNYQNISCEAKHLCSNKPLREYLAETKDFRQAQVQIFVLPELETGTSNDATLVCQVLDFLPSQVAVHWELNKIKLSPSRYSSSQPQWSPENRSYSMYSWLLVPRSEQTEGEYSCVVTHESRKVPVTQTQTISNVFVHSPPQVTLLQFAKGLVCLAHGFSPAPINITWIMNNSTTLPCNDTSSLSRAPDGKFTQWSYLQVSWKPGAVYTCKVSHVTTTLSLSKSQPEITADNEYFDVNLYDSTPEDSTEEIWNTARTFLILFIITLLYSSFITLVKVK
ncbi:hypothetical protein AGOR_G00197980 [Albula goreensis]|uniref:Ig-like domain-containing protein n=1 Tax=Albula goreensis TaxID=1534307 RepID=A0A8T3CNC7_9TELE|nr:hypothetical protein AGOR_G00197980 [Albula goreensis]